MPGGLSQLASLKLNHDHILKDRVHGIKGRHTPIMGIEPSLFEIESLEARDRYFPRPGEESEEFTRFFEQHPKAAAAMEKWQKLSPTDRKTTLRPITLRSLSSTFSPDRE